MLQRICALVAILCFPVFAFSQNAMIYGTVQDEHGNPIELVNIAIEGTSFGTMSKPDGTYRLDIPANQRHTLVFSNVSFEVEKRHINLLINQQLKIDIRLKKRANTLTEFVKKDDRVRYEAGAIQIESKKANELPSTIGGIEGILKTFVGSHNELTSQYTVRGGNYDENLVYVNDFEIYRPFLVRSGQQEGLSFVNADLVSNVNFSVGGFQARYGDKMSSVLDVTYKRPKSFQGSAMLSLLGANIHVEGATKNEKLTYLVGLRQKSNQYLLQAQPTKGVYNPSFTDIQALVNYRVSKKWEIELIGNYARNRFNFIPQEQTTSFGVINQAYQLRIFYNGAEIDQFDSRFGGISTTYRPNEKLKLKLLASGFQTNERETYDISGEYLLGELETDLGKQNFGQIKTYLGTGIVHNYARNYLKVNVGNLAHRGSFDVSKHFISWGLDANFTSISDKLLEWERRDSAGFTQPYYNDSIVMKKLYHSSANFNYTRLSGFIQDNFRLNDSLDLTISAGVRFNYSFLNNELVVSPRLQLAYKPHWKRDIVFKAAAGLYAQPAFYREMRDLNGNVNTQLLAQKSAHYVLGTDYNFKMYRRPFKLTTELYYKKLWDLVPYEYDNVRIRYFGKNDAIGYAYGGELRLYGDLVKDATSWISIGVMKTMEDITDDKIILKNQAGADSTTIYPGYVPRPTDQRFMLGMYFEDYLPRNKNLKAHINMMYATGLPFGPPNGNRYDDTLRLPDYKRVDIGFSALLLDGDRKERPSHSFFRNLHSVWLSLEVFNLLGIQNTLSYSWIQDQTTNKIYAVPNRLTSRLLNVKLIINF
ncbi:MAG: TonB-dependent receptor [Bacteroidetes bacterium]|nr:TonB-dependent receptor [Bacteroidota bacterium]MBS1740559.1 TonB-dependent receptor [Bacteroidota bacterium]